MRGLWAAWLAGGAAIVSAAPGQSIVLNTQRVYGREYVSMPDVQAVFGFKAQAGRNHAFTLTSPQARVNFTLDSREADLQGVKYWLSAPPAAHGGQVWLPAIDVVKTFDPLLRGSGLAASHPVRAIVLDAGHGGEDKGASSRNGLIEKQLALDVTRRLETLLHEAGYHVVLTRTDDHYIPLIARSGFARVNNADLFVSIHFNSASPAAEPRGAETYCLTPAGAPSTQVKTVALSREELVSFNANRFDSDNVVLAHYIQQSLVSKAGAVERGVKRARFEVLKDLNCPAVLVECGFLSSPADAKQIGQPAYRQQLAAAIASGVEAYKKSTGR